MSKRPIYLVGTWNPAAGACFGLYAAATGVGKAKKAVERLIRKGLAAYGSQGLSRAAQIRELRADFAAQPKLELLNAKLSGCCVIVSGSGEDLNERGKNI